jgi:hypothetical protein
MEEVRQGVMVCKLPLPTALMAEPTLLGKVWLPRQRSRPSDQMSLVLRKREAGDVGNDLQMESTVYVVLSHGSLTLTSHFFTGLSSRLEAVVPLLGLGLIEPLHM